MPTNLHWSAQRNAQHEGVEPTHREVDVAKEGCEMRATFRAKRNSQNICPGATGGAASPSRQDLMNRCCAGDSLIERCQFGAVVAGCGSSLMLLSAEVGADFPVDLLRFFLLGGGSRTP